MHQKRTTNCSFWLHEEWLWPQKEQFFCSFLNFIEKKVIFLEKKVICTFCIAKCIRKGQKIVPFDYMKNGPLHHLSKKSIFCSFLNVIFLEKKVICTFCLAKCIRKGQKIVPFDYMKNGSHHCFFWKRAFFFCSFLNLIFLEKKVICTFCLAKCIRKGQKNVPFDYMKNGSRHKNSNFFCSFLNVIFLEKKTICTFCLAKCIRKGQQIVPFDYMKNGSRPQKEQFFVPFWTSSF